MTDKASTNNEQIELKIIDAKIECLDLMESKYSCRNNWVSQVIFGSLLLTEILATSTIVHQASHSKDTDKWLKPIAASALVVGFTLGSCYLVSDLYAVRQQQKKLRQQYEYLMRDRGSIS